MKILFGLTHKNEPAVAFDTLDRSPVVLYRLSNVWKTTTSDNFREVGVVDNVDGDLKLAVDEIQRGLDDVAQRMADIRDFKTWKALRDSGQLGKLKRRVKRKGAGEPLDTRVDLTDPGYTGETIEASGDPVTVTMQ